MKENILAGNLCTICFFLLAYSCSHNPQSKSLRVENKKVSEDNHSRLVIYNKNIYPAILNTVQSGDIVTRLGNDLTSEMLRQMNLRDKSFSHIGIASLEQDTVFIYHAIGGEFNPDQKLKREPIWSFAHPDDNKKIGIFRMKMCNELIPQLINSVHHIYAMAIPFDMDFDLTTDNRLYCAEFVGKSFEQALKRAHFFHRSLLMGKAFIEVDDITGNQSVRKIQSWEY